MEIGTLYFTKHAYERLVERTFLQLKWNKKRYPLRGYRDYLFKFLDELFSQPIKVSKTGKDEFLGEMKLFDADLIIPIHVNFKEGYIPTILVKRWKIHKDKLIEWILPIKLKPYRPKHSKQLYFNETELFIDYNSFINDLEDYSKIRNFIELEPIENENINNHQKIPVYSRKIQRVRTI